MGCYWLSNIQVNLPLPSSDPILSAAGVETDDVDDGSPKLSSWILEPNLQRLKIECIWSSARTLPYGQLLNPCGVVWDAVPYQKCLFELQHTNALLSDSECEHYYRLILLNNHPECIEGQGPISSSKPKDQSGGPGLENP